MEFVLGAGIILLASGLIAAARFKQRYQRTNEVSKAAKDLDLDYSPNAFDSVIKEITDFPLFNRSPSLNRSRDRERTNLVVVNQDTSTILMFDYAYNPPFRSGFAYGAIQTVTTVLSPSLQVPRFQMRPRSPFKQVFDSTILDAFRDRIRLKSFPKFDRLFWLGGDSKEDIRDFFCVDVVNRLEKLDGYSIEARSGAIIIYRERMLVEGSKLEEQIQIAEQVHAVFADRQWARRAMVPGVV